MTPLSFARRRSTSARSHHRATLLGLLACSAPAAAWGQSPETPPATREAMLEAAERAIEAGRPWQATRALAPLLAAPGRDSVATLIAARAAVAWEGWSSASRLLEGEPWLESAFGGEGRALLARARLERGDPRAVADAEAAVAAAGDGIALGPRLVLLARALDRAGRLDSAAAVYRRAAVRLPAVSEWLVLRAAGVTADSAARAALFRAITLPAAVPRIPWTDAEARARTGDRAGAIRAYDSLGAALEALELRARAAESAAERAALRASLTAALRPRLGEADSRRAIALLDGSFAPLTPVEELLVARRAAAIGMHQRAVRGFARSQARLLTDADRLAWGTSLARLDRHAEALRRFEAVRGSEAFQARYQRARSLLRLGRRAAALTQLRRLLLGGGDSAVAATAGYLLANLHEDAGQDAEARRIYREVAQRYPGTGNGPRAAFQAALIAFILGDPVTAGREWTDLAARQGRRSEGAASLYWAGRAALAAGAPARARAHWEAVLEQHPESYYVTRAAERLDVAVPEPPDEGAPLGGSEFGAALDRATVLERLGLRVEARQERDRVARDADRTLATLADAARAFAVRGQTGRALRLGQRALDRGAPLDGRLARLLYPLPLAHELEAEARRAGVDPLLAAGLIRQESGFDPAARSAADARGLMQVVPALGAALARRERLPDWDPVLLYQPDLNLHFGLTHLAQTLRRYARVEHALAAYNAGASPVRRWLELRGTRDDPEVFVERIPYVETRDYVRVVLRNRVIYRILYPGVR